MAATRIAPGVGANLIGQHAQERNQEATVYVGNLDFQSNEDILWELFTQAGPVANVYVPKDRVTGSHQGYGFVEFRNEEDSEYAVKILNMVKLFGKPIRVNKASQDRRQVDVGANLFIGNLDPDVDEQILYNTFSAFGVIVNNPKIMRDPESGLSKGFGFVSYDSFEASDAAIEAMHGQYLCNRAISVSYAYKKDTKGERHGTAAERLLAANNPSTATRSRPHTMFASAPPVPPSSSAAPPPPPAAPVANGVAPPPPPSLHHPMAPPAAPMPSYPYPSGGPQMPPPPPPSSMGGYGSAPPPPASAMGRYQPPPPPMGGYQQGPPPPQGGYPGPGGGYGGPPAMGGYSGPPQGYGGQPPQQWQGGMAPPPPPQQYGARPPGGQQGPPPGWQPGMPPLRSQ